MASQALAADLLIRTNAPDNTASALKTNTFDSSSTADRLAVFGARTWGSCGFDRIAGFATIALKAISAAGAFSGDIFASGRQTQTDLRAWLIDGDAFFALPAHPLQGGVANLTTQTLNPITSADQFDITRACRSIADFADFFTLCACGQTNAQDFGGSTLQKRTGFSACTRGRDQRITGLAAAILPINRDTNELCLAPSTCQRRARFAFGRQFTATSFAEASIQALIVACARPQTAAI